MKLKSLRQVGATGLLCLFVGFLFGQGSTTASINGRITDTNGEPLIGANVLAEHTQSGSIYGNTTDVDGFFRIPGMRVGGPYKVTLSYTGFKDQVFEGIFLELGQTLKLDSKLDETATELQAVEVVASSSEIFDGNRTGQETVINEKSINTLPTTTRSIADFARLNPLVRVDNNNSDGFSLSIAGQNNRFNAIYIDGIVNNDVFGLAGSGTNGGQTGAGPVSIDAIEQFQVSVAPYDVRLSGFAGGSVNAVTRSGTNDFEGSAYWFFRNEKTTGRTPDFQPDNENFTRQRLAPFTAQTFGARLGGPIIKNKLFFFVNAEFQRDRTPEPFENFEERYQGDSDRSDINSLVNKLQGEFGFDPGTFENNESTLDRNFFLAKLDYNLNQDHKLSFRYSFNDIENLEARNSSTTRINFENGSEFFPSTTHTAGAEWNGVFGSKLSNNLKFGYTRVRDDRNGFGDPFPNVRIEDGEGRIEFGTERFSTANRLDQDIFTISNDFQVFQKRHTLTFGVNFEYYNVGNLFIRENFGAYQYDSLSQFLDDVAATQYDRSFSQVDNVTGDQSAAIASFTGSQFGIYAQDEWQASDNFKLTFGLRLDIPIFADDVPVNPGFNDTTTAKIVAAQANTSFTNSRGTFNYFDGDPLQGAATGQFISTQLLFSPRIGFNWDIGGNKTTQLRGGAGIFTSRIPLVWFGGAYNNYGLNIGGTRLNDRLVFIPEFDQQPVGVDGSDNLIFEVDPNNPTPSGQIDLFAEDFRLPQVFKANIAVDQKLGFWGLIGTFEFLYTKYINYVYYQNLNLRAPEEGLTGTPDDRPIFNVFDEVDDTYTGIFLATNTNRGYGYNFAATITKPFSNGFNGTIGYSFGDSYTVNDGTSSQNNSQWRGYQNINGLNNLGEVQRSDFAPLHRVFASLSYRIEYAGFLGTQLSIFYNGSSGNNFSYTLNDDGFGGLINDGAFNDNNLVYIPRDQSEINFVATTVDGQTFSPQDQWNALNQFIEDNRELRENRGEYAERNSARNPFVNMVDLKLIQDFFIETGNGKRHNLQFTLDIFNFGAMVGNWFDRSWGRINDAGAFGNFTLYNVEGTEEGTNTPQYTLNSRILRGQEPWTDDFIDTGRVRSSRWSMQIGLRYLFN